MASSNNILIPSVMNTCPIYEDLRLPVESGVGWGVSRRKQFSLRANQIAQRKNRISSAFMNTANKWQKTIAAL
jgi:hypothetical protein